MEVGNEEVVTLYQRLYMKPGFSYRCLSKFRDGCLLYLDVYDISTNCLIHMRQNAEYYVLF